jgi:hypothetical protein
MGPGVRRDDMDIQFSNSHESSYSAKAEYPVHRGFSDQSSAPLEYWITRRSLSSGAHSRDPLTGDDE